VNLTMIGIFLLSIHFLILTCTCECWLL
jgi:hypothetical protein